MSDTATPIETARGFCPPTVTQYSVFLDNRVGKLYDLVETFEDSPCNICAIDVHEASECAIVRVITNRAAIARRLIQEHNLAFVENEVLIVELSRGHSLPSLCLSLLAAEINIKFAYPLMLRPNGTPTIALSVDDPTLAGQILRRKEFRLFGEADLPAA